MFERFTPATKDLIIAAQAERRSLGDHKLKPHHLLLALLADEGPSGDALRHEGVSADRITQRLRRMETPDGSSSGENDDRLLEQLGIDIDAIRQSLDQTFGPGSFDRARQRRSASSAPSGRRSGRKFGQFDAQSKRVVEESLREALRLKTKHIGPEHVGLALLKVDHLVTRRLLTDERVDLADLRASWEAVARSATTRSS